MFGALAIGSIALQFAALAVEKMTPELGSPSSDVVKDLMHGSLVARFGGGYVEYLSILVMLVAGLLLARLLRGTTETSHWLASIISATAILGASSVGFAAGAAAIYDGHHGASVQTVAMMNDLRNFSYILSLAVLGVFTLCVGIAAVTTRALPRWIGWAGVAVGIVCLASPPGARNDLHNLANLLQMVWWVALGVVALSRRTDGQPRRPIKD